MSAHEYVRPIAAAAAVEPLRLLILTSHCQSHLPMHVAASERLDASTCML
jgi:hypothetical protein